ncbi:hypothetical protein E2986_14040 [Frieseomelitta varia]|uniref:BTB domain-containing protein n=1 Tax=Frieseomelitta varia TaxID=561572 RepID=A0A833W111_9HYME|nr:hypothetical protein E2986_14040 [Frieseomelitta varia]
MRASWLLSMRIWNSCRVHVRIAVADYVTANTISTERSPRRRYRAGKENEYFMETDRYWGVHYSGGMAGQHYCLRWNNYQSNMTSVFHQLLQTEAFVDVTLACNEASLKAHKLLLFAQVVLSACSSYFQKLLLSNPCKHPTIIMPQDVCFNDLKFIIEFVYRGEIDVSQAELQVRMTIICVI